MIRVARSVPDLLRRPAGFAGPAGSAALLFAALLAGTAALAGCGDDGVGENGEVAQPDEPFEYPEDY